MSAAKVQTTRGRCQCRSIEYEFEGKPKWVMHCHCESCRRAVSSAVATYVGVDIGQFRYLKGEQTEEENDALNPMKKDYNKKEMSYLV